MPLTERFGSKKEIKAAMRVRKNSGLFKKLAAEERFKFRPIVEPTEWEKGYYHYINDADIKFMWCSRRPECPRCEVNHKPTPVWLANVLDVEQGKVQILQVPAGIANQLYERWEKYNTICDRDYEILRQGSGLNDTRYMLDWDDKSHRNLSRYAPADIPAAILMELGLSPEDEPEEEIPRSSKFQRIREWDEKKKKSPRYEEEEEDEDYEDEEEDEEIDQYAELDRSELKREIKKYDPSFVAKKSQSDEDLRDILRELAEDAEEDEEEDEYEDDEEEEEEEVPPSRKKSSRLDQSRKSPSRGSGKLSTDKSKRVIRRA